MFPQTLFYKKKGFQIESLSFYTISRVLLIVRFDRLSMTINSEPICHIELVEMPTDWFVLSK